MKTVGRFCESRMLSGLTQKRPTNSRRSFHLLARDRANVGNVPADTHECLHDCDNHDYQKKQMHQGGDNRPEKYQNAADSWNRSEHRVHDSGHDVKEKPSATENDRLHGVEAHEAVVLFQNVENNATDQRNAGDRRSYVRRQSSLYGFRTRLGSRRWRRWRWSRLLVWHDLHTQNDQCLVKQSCFLRIFFAFAPRPSAI